MREALRMSQLMNSDLKNWSDILRLLSLNDEITQAFPGL